MDKDAIIIDESYAGLSAARQLSRARSRVLVVDSPSVFRQQATARNRSAPRPVSP